MTVSALTYSDLANYLRIEAADITTAEQATLTAFLSAAVEYVQTYSGLTTEECDEHADIAIAVLCVAGDFYTNRDMYTNLKGTGTATVNRTVQAILDKYATNLVPIVEDEDEDEDEEES
jgi:hypothetical protein